MDKSFDFEKCTFDTTAYINLLLLHFSVYSVCYLNANLMYSYFFVLLDDVELYHIKKN